MEKTNRERTPAQAEPPKPALETSGTTTLDDLPVTANLTPPPGKPRRAQTRSRDIAAMAKIDEELLDLSPAEQSRVLRWIYSKWGNGEALPAG